MLVTQMVSALHSVLLTDFVAHQRPMYKKQPEKLMDAPKRYIT